MFINELAERQLLVIYPGRFQPFHKGHHAVYEYLTGKFGRNNVYIATSNKTDNLKSPFTFSEKSYFMQLTGVPADRIIETASPYNIQSVLSGGNLNVNSKNAVVIFAVSEKDMAEDPRFKSWSKKDGSPTYLQPMPKDLSQLANMEQHGYIMTVPTFDFKVLGQPMRSGTELRAMYTDADPKQRQAIIKDLFGRYTAEAEQLMSKILSAKSVEPAPLGNKARLQKVATPKAEPVAESNKVDPKRMQLILKARIAHPLAKSDAEALMLYLSDKEERDIHDVEDEEHGLESRVADLEKKFAQLSQVKEAGGTGVIASKKQAHDPRYSMSLTKDVRPGQINKSLKAFDLAEADREPYQQAVDRLTLHWIERINNELDEIKSRLGTEQLPPEYKEKLRQRIEQLKAERAKLAFNPQ
jgi:hypothetical protein